MAGLIGTITEYGISAARSLAKRTSFGRTISEIKSAAQEAKKIELSLPASSTADKFESLYKNVQGREKEIIKDLAQDEKFANATRTYMHNATDSFQSLSAIEAKDLSKVITGSCGVGFNKGLQIISSDEKLMAKLPEELQNVIKNARSNNTATRTLEEVQTELKTMFGDKYTAHKTLGVGTIGEAYLIKDASGKEFVAKMIKKNVTVEAMDAEEEILTKLIGKIAKDPKEALQKQNMVRSLYADWKKELDFTQEATYNQLLAKAGKRYNVAKITELSKDAKCAIYEKAEGLQADKFLQMVREFKANPAEYSEKYKNVIAENPWMQDPQKALGEFSKNLAKSFNEMLLFAKKGGNNIMHGDPHTGNIFLSPNKKGKIITTFIDTGNCCIRSTKDLVKDLSFLSSYLVGDSKEIARYFVSKAQTLPRTVSTEQLINDVAKKLDKNLFKSGQNVSDFERNQKVINNILEESNIALKSEDATSLKATFQSASTMKEVINLNGSHRTQMIPMMIPDVAKGIGRMALRTNPFAIVKPAGEKLTGDTKNALFTLFQMMS